MAIGDKTYPWAAHTAWGFPFNFLHNAIEHIFAYTHHKKKISAATVGAVLSSTASTTSQQTITSGLTNPDVPRVLAVTLGGTGLTAGTVQVTGTNIEGKPITDSFAYTTTGQVTGSLVFKTVNQVIFPAQGGTSATLTVDTTAKIGLNHRCVPNKTSIIGIWDTTTETYGNLSNKPTEDAAPTSTNVDNQFVEKNWVQPAKTLDGTTTWYFFYWFHKVLVYPPKDSPQFYSTTTSTSTSSTSTSTSTSSTSTSISTSSTSTSSTSTSFSSTSTSTTTLPI